MLVSTRGRYALRVMLELAQRPADSFTPLPVIAEAQSVSEKYLESIVVLLSRAGLVDGVRGKGGGYRLTRTPDQYAVGEILRLTEGSLAPVACLEGAENTCPRAGHCHTLPMWEKLDTIITTIWTAFRWPISCGRRTAAACKRKIPAASAAGIFLLRPSRSPALG